ncbi:MAG: Glucose-6-phosphate isomerase [Chlamydiia bacterium]|nr:Glucose-6-phosphate isomerase [Chlamydiia bacterium]MCH9618788.1 Glucose-6-phosphate isomerase [Chlamydiia bacterium]MCH9624619.1 Glucose-6-phosphate isomerase [Chlamydiia bacterium]
MFSKYPSFSKLEKLSKDPVDLAGKGVLTSARVHDMQLSACSWKMLYGTERVDDKVVGALVEMAGDADVFTKMEKMQDMQVMNFVTGCKSEDRRVGHTAIRASTLSKNASKEAKEASKESAVEMEKLTKFISQTAEYKHMVVCGIGGSYLGALAISKALKGLHATERTLHFASNIDPDKIATILDEIDLEKTIVAVISKSGGTMEIKAQEIMLRHHFEAKGLNTKEHFIMVTGKGSPMDNPLVYKEIFYMWDFIGGRYSVSSMVGAVPVAFMSGMDVWKDFLKGASDMDYHALYEKDVTKNMPLMGALLGIWNRNFLKMDTLCIVPYSSSLDLWAGHIQQLYMESNGKHVAQEDGSFIDFNTCPIIFGTCGTEGQHSYFQAIHQGTVVVPLEYIGFLHPQRGTDEEIEGSFNQEKLLSNLFAQSISLARGKKSDNNNQDFPGNRPSRMLLTNSLSAYSMGALLAYYESIAAFQGFIWGINSFDQEGVQLGKLIANNIVDEYKHLHEKGSYTNNPSLDVEIAYMKEIKSLDKGLKKNTRSA